MNYKIGYVSLESKLPFQRNAIMHFKLYIMKGIFRFENTY